jgi:hypothetical protein
LKRDRDRVGLGLAVVLEDVEVSERPKEDLERFEGGLNDSFQIAWKFVELQHIC